MAISTELKELGTELLKAFKQAACKLGSWALDGIQTLTNKAFDWGKETVEGLAQTSEAIPAPQPAG